MPNESDLATIKLAFGMYDHDSKDEITKDELIKIFGSLGFNLSREEIQGVMSYTP